MAADIAKKKLETQFKKMSRDRNRSHRYRNIALLVSKCHCCEQQTASLSHDTDTQQHWAVGLVTLLLMHFLFSQRMHRVRMGDLC